MMNWDCNPCWRPNPGRVWPWKEDLPAQERIRASVPKDVWNQLGENKNDWWEWQDGGGRAGIRFPEQFYTHGSSTSSIHDELNSAGVAEQSNPEMEKAPQLLELGSRGDICFRGLRFDFLSSELNPKAEAACFLVYMGPKTYNNCHSCQSLMYDIVELMRGVTLVRFPSFCGRIS